MSKNAVPGRARQPGEDYLLAMLQTLWPSPLRVSTIAIPWRPPHDALEFVALPSVTRPKLLIPRGPRNVAAAALRHFKTPTSVSQRIGLGGLALLLRLGGARLLPNCVRIEGRSGNSSDIQTHLAARLGCKLVLGLYIGPVRAVQKPILQVISPEGRTLAFAKVGVDSLTRKLVKNEGEALTLLHRQNFEHLNVPAVLDRSQWRGHEILVQEAVSRSGSVEPLVLAKAMVELATVAGVQTDALADSPFWHALCARQAALRSSSHSRNVGWAIERIAQRLGSVRLGFGAMHGDWAPWNMTSSADRVTVWDWEGFETGVPLGFDAIHYQVQGDVVLRAAPPAEAFAAASGGAGMMLRPFGIPAHVGPLVVLLYLLTLVTRYLESGESESRLARFESWLAPELLRQVDDVTRVTLEGLTQA